MKNLIYRIVCILKGHKYEHPIVGQVQMFDVRDKLMLKCVRCNHEKSLRDN